MGKLFFVSGNIIDYYKDMDSIVNAQNKYMINGSGICGAIYSTAGVELLDYCKKTYNKEMEPCEVRVTSGFKMNIPIIHVYAPIYGEWENPVGKLLEAYQNVLDAIKENNYRKVLIPSLGTGIHGYKHEDVSLPIMKLLFNFCINNDVDIYFVNRFSITTNIYLESYINVANITDNKKLLDVLVYEKKCYDEFIEDKDVCDLSLYEKLIYYKITKDESVLEENKNSVFITSIIGHAVGDAMGVPVEFCLREKLMQKPVTTMLGYGSHPVPSGYWSDDTSMEIATIDSFINCGRFDYDDIMKNFIKWVQNGAYTPNGEVFDIGRTCLRAIRKYMSSLTENPINPIDAGQKDLMGNGNGALMRMLPVPLYCYFKKSNEEEIIKLSSDISSLTHGHEISKLACYIYTKYVMFLIDGLSKEDAYNKIRNLDYSYFNDESLSVFDRLIKNDIRELALTDIKSSAYVVDTIEASFWVLLNCNNYKQSIIGAINLGQDTDTIGAIVGSMASILYGYKDIPEDWINGLAKKDYLIDLATKFENKITKR